MNRTIKYFNRALIVMHISFVLCYSEQCCADNDDVVMTTSLRCAEEAVRAVRQRRHRQCVSTSSGKNPPNDAYSTKVLSLCVEFRYSTTI